MDAKTFSQGGGALPPSPPPGYASGYIYFIVGAINVLSKTIIVFGFFFLLLLFIFSLIW